MQASKSRWDADKRNFPDPFLFQVADNEFLWALSGLCQLYRLPFDAALVRGEFAPPNTFGQLLEASRKLGFKAGVSHEKPQDASRWQFPCIAVLRATEKQADAAPTDPDRGQRPGGEQVLARLAIVLRADADRLLILEHNSSSPAIVRREDFVLRFTGQVMFATPQGAKAPQADEPEAAKQFGFTWFFAELLKYRTIWRDVLLASLAVQLMALATPLFTQVVIDKVVVHRTMNTLIVIGVGLAVFMIFSATMSWIRQYLVLHTGNRIDAVLALKVFEHVLKLPLRFYEHRPTGIVVARIHGVEQIREFLASAAVTLVLDCPFLLIFLGIMFYYSVALTLFSVAILAVIVLLSLAVAPILRNRLNQQFLIGARNQAFLTEHIAGMETLKSLQMESHLKNRYGDMLSDYLAAGFKTKQLGNTYNSLAQLLEQLMTLGILCYGAYLATHDAAFTIGMLVAFQMFANRLSQPLLRLVGLWQQFQQANIAVKRLGDLMNAPAEPYTLIPHRDNTGAGRVEVRSISFRYSEQLPFLYRQLSLSVAPGQCIAIMGSSGSGKSTLAKLLQGFYWPTEGQVLLDERDTRHLSANELRQHFGVVPQETILFSGTLYENLAVADPHATFDEIVHACKLAEIHDVIDKLPSGYQTAVGERGVGLSGGQKQRIAIARALLKRPKILIFDEAVSNLDGPTSEHFARTINALKGKVTILFITHQLPKTLLVDHVIRIDQATGGPLSGTEVSSAIQGLHPREKQ